MSKIYKIIIIIFIATCVLLLAYSGYFLFTDFLKANKTEINKTVNPGKLFGPTALTRAQNLDTAKILEWTNHYRAQENLKNLTLNDKLIVAANTKTDDMFLKQYFEHNSPDGTTPAQLVANAGYDYRFTGENLALGDFSSEKDLVDAWMASPGHRANILNANYTEIGISAKLGTYENRKTWISVQEFGTPAPICENPDKSLLSQVDVLKTQIEKQNSDINAQYESYKQLVLKANDNYEKCKNANSAGDFPLAKTYCDQGDELKEQADALFSKIKNLEKALAELSQNANTLTNKYNAQVNSFNACQQN